MKSKSRHLICVSFLALSLTSCGITRNAPDISEDVIEFRQVLSVSSIDSDIEAYGQKFTGVDCRNPPSNFEPPIYLIGCSSDEKEVFLLGASELDGNSIKQAKSSRNDSSGNQWFVTIDFNDAGTKKLADFTRRVTSLPAPMNQIAITSDNLVIVAPVINEEITAGSAVITGNFTMQEALDLSKSIKNRSAIPQFLKWRE